MERRLSALRIAIALALTMPASVHGQASTRSSAENTALAIQAARVAYRESEAAIARGTWSQRDTNVVCEEDRAPFEVRR